MSKRPEVQVDQKDVIVLTPKNVQVFNLIFFIQYLNSFVHALLEKSSFAPCPFKMISLNVFG